MAAIKILFGGPAGQTFTCKLYEYGEASVIGTDTAIVELMSGWYEAAFTSVLVGKKLMIVTDDNAADIGVASFEVDLLNAAGDYKAYEPNPLVDNIGADTDSLINLFSTTVFTNIPVESNSKIRLTRGDAYDAVSNAKLTWTTSQDITAATHGNFTIRSTRDQVLIDQDTSGVTVTATGTTFTVSLTGAATDLLVAGSLKFDAEVVFTATSHWTIANGECLVIQDQSR